MLPANCSRLCRGNSAWVGVFARITGSLALSVSVILSLGYRLLRAFSLA